jgi:hypothetical protein
MDSMTRLRRAALTFVLAGIGSCALNPDSGGTGGAAGGETGSSATGGGGGSAMGTGGTGGGNLAGTSSGIPRDLSLASLTTDQASTLCDWANLKQGGYGRLVTCSGRAEATNPSNFSCVNSTTSIGNRCPQLTVGNIEDCANVTGADLCKLESASECVAVTTCDQ